MSQFLNWVRVFFQIQRGLLFQYGWLRAWREGRPVDSAGEPLPWITYPAIDFLSQFDFADATVFEWGGGASTFWWSGRCQSITTVESNPIWIEKLRKTLPSSVQLRGVETTVDAEVQALLNEPVSNHDIFSIDNHGPFRWHCAEVAASRLKPGGFIILDNSDQCLKACEVLRTKGFIQIDFTGFSPCNGYAATTSVFFRDNFRFRPKESFRPSRSPAQPNPPWPNC